MFANHRQTHVPQIAAEQPLDQAGPSGLQCWRAHAQPSGGSVWSPKSDR